MKPEIQHNQNLWGTAKVVIREFTVISISKTRKISQTIQLLPKGTRKKVQSL